MAGIDEIVVVPETQAETFAARIERMNARARRLGARARVNLEEVGRGPRPVRVTRRVYREGAFHVESADEPRPCVLYRMHCPEPTIKLSGWSWAGWIAVRRAEKDSVTGIVDAPVTHADPAAPIRSETIDGAIDDKGRMRCDHCGTFRNRRMGFVVRDERGVERVVGSSCLLDHVGHDPKAVLAHFRAIDLLRPEIARERRQDDFRAEVYDWAAYAEAEAAATRARDAVEHPVRRIVAAVLRAMGAQGFYARYTGEGKVATEEAVREILDGGGEPNPGIAARADEIIAWARGRGTALPEDPASSVSLGAYLAADPGFRVVEDYRAAGHAPLGRRYADGEVAEVTYLGSEPADRVVAVGYGTKTIERRRHVFADAAGSRLLWETASEGLSERLVRGASLRIRFRTKRTEVERVRLVSRIANVRAA